MVIDDDDDNHIYTSGSTWWGNKGIVVKLTSSLDEVYTTTTSSNDHFQDIAVKNDRQIVTASSREDVSKPHHLILRPNGDCVTDLFCVPSDVEHYTVVDDEESNGDTDYVFTYPSSSYVNDTFDFADHTSETREIMSVSICAWVRRGGALDDYGIPNRCKFIVRNETVNYSPELMVLGGNWDIVSYSFSENPETNQPWTWEDIDNLKAGIAFMGTMWTFMACTQLYIDVDYRVYEDQYTISLHRKSDGMISGKYQIGDVHDAPPKYATGTMGVAVDSNGDILASGGEGAIDTIKVCIVPRGIVVVLVDTDEQISEG